ncbi:hypothetical protein C8R44DRAFT_741145 [Mycena epipterygia]|nr:hypothetical protein C8R44DRAFT_741145 [Mycena epipterygia]
MIYAEEIPEVREGGRGEAEDGQEERGQRGEVEVAGQGGVQKVAARNGRRGELEREGGTARGGRGWVRELQAAESGSRERRHAGGMPMGAAGVTVMTAGRPLRGKSERSGKERKGAGGGRGASAMSVVGWLVQNEKHGTEEDERIGEWEAGESETEEGNCKDGQVVVVDERVTQRKWKLTA